MAAADLNPGSHPATDRARGMGRAMFPHRARPRVTRTHLRAPHGPVLACIPFRGTQSGPQKQKQCPSPLYLLKNAASIPNSLSVAAHVLRSSLNSSLPSTCFAFLHPPLLCMDILCSLVQGSLSPRPGKCPTPVFWSFPSCLISSTPAGSRAWGWRRHGEGDGGQASNARCLREGREILRHEPSGPLSLLPHSFTRNIRGPAPGRLLQMLCAPRKCQPPSLCPQSLWSRRKTAGTRGRQ